MTRGDGSNRREATGDTQKDFMSLLLTKVEIEGVYKDLDAYMDTEYRWNGWVCPWFTKEQAEAFMAQANANCDAAGGGQGTGRTHYDEAKDAYVVDNNEGEGEDGEPDVFEGEDVEVDGKILHLYPIGNTCWIWDEVEAQELPRLNITVTLQFTEDDQLTPERYQKVIDAVAQAAEKASGKKVDVDVTAMEYEERRK